MPEDGFNSHFLNKYFNEVCVKHCLFSALQYSLISFGKDKINDSLFVS